MATNTTTQRTATLIGRRSIEDTLHITGTMLMRYGLVVVLAWIGAMKFTAYEASSIEPLVANSPLMSWVYHLLSVRAFSIVLGIVEVGTAVMIAARPWSANMAAIGSGLAAMTFLTTLSFLLSTPGWEVESGRLSSPLGGAGAVPAQRRGVAGCGVVVIGRSLTEPLGHDDGNDPRAGRKQEPSDASRVASTLARIPHGGC